MAQPAPGVPPEVAPPALPRTARRRRLVLLAICLIELLAGAYLGWRWLHYRLTHRHALELAGKSAFTTAEPLLKELAQESPDDVEVVQALAHGYLQSDNTAEAETYLTQWCRLRPQDAEPFKLRMDLYRHDKQTDKALADGRRVLELEPDNSVVRQRVAGLAFSLGQFDIAESECRRYLDRSPHDEKVFELLAECRRAQGDSVEAAAIADRLLKEDPNRPGALMLRGTLYREANQADKAIPLFRKVLALDPNRQRTARYELSLALERAGQTEEARRVMAEVRHMQDAEVLGIASGLQPDNLDLQVRTARAFLDNGNTNDGLHLLETVLARDPNFAPAHEALAEYYQQQGQADLAAEHRRLAGQTP